ncbi:MAG: 4-(cytidine 5'-diphospho)-2-C-methyl-D-erythritol kinase [Lentisphaeria bacterium]|nr:4-(cytidine 5'-diphospho)-2-C-methyl-D-erythritol kinase [Lentisphaeria bacterium]
MNNTSVILKTAAPAKINLSLKLVGKRQDGYHLLDSIFVPVNSLADDITITLSHGDKSVTISSNLAEMTDAANNLCSKAAEKYFKMTGIDVNCNIDLQKKIPIGAGLGGGSSDCAAVLKLLNSHYQKLTEKELHELALSLGADVPFFLVNKISHVTGIGENIVPFECPASLHILIFSPYFSISTPWAFKHIDPSVIGEDSSNSSSNIINALQNDDVMTAAEYLKNDFETLLFSKFPAYLIWKKELLDLHALHVGISGSGSSFFALFANMADLENAKEKFSCKYKMFFK